MAISEEKTCIVNINHKDGTISRCCRPIKSKEYPFCKIHFSKRLTSEQINKDLNQFSDSICQEILVSGKNKDKCCSKNIFRHQFCFGHLQKKLSTCYNPGCDYLSFYPNGLCSYHCGIESENGPVSICPCPKHNYTLKKCNNLYFCQTHYNQDCQCLEQYFSKKLFNDVILPDEIIELIFTFVYPNDFPVLKCLNKTYNKLNYLDIISQNLEKQIVKNIYVFFLQEMIDIKNNHVTNNQEQVLSIVNLHNNNNDNNNDNQNNINNNDIINNDIISSLHLGSQTVLQQGQNLENQDNQNNKDLNQKFISIFINTILDIYSFESNNIKSLFNTNNLSKQQTLKFIKNIYKRVILIVCENEIHRYNVLDIFIDNHFDVFIMPHNVDNLSFIYNSNRYRFNIKDLNLHNEIRIRFYNIFLLILYHQLINLWPKIQEDNIIDYKSFGNLGQQLITPNKCHQSYQQFKDIHFYLHSMLHSSC